MLKVLQPDDTLSASHVYQLYRGGVVECNRKMVRIWVDFTHLELCFARLNREAYLRIPWELISSFENFFENDILKTRINCFKEFGHRYFTKSFTIHYDHQFYGMINACERFLVLSFENRAGVEHVQRNLSQYLWGHHQEKSGNLNLKGNPQIRSARGNKTAVETRAILEMNLDPSIGLKYLQDHHTLLFDTEGSTDSPEVVDSIGHWLLTMSFKDRCGIHPSKLGALYSEAANLPLLKAFVNHLDFETLDMVGGLRVLFDTLKPGGESQTLDRLLEVFSVKFAQNVECSADAIHSLAFSILLLNTDLHGRPPSRKQRGFRCSRHPGMPPMTKKAFLDNCRMVVEPSSFSDDQIHEIYEKIRGQEIRIQPNQYVDFSKLPVQPQIEGWLHVRLSLRRRPTGFRYFGILALNRIYFFADTSDLHPILTIDIGEATYRRRALPSGWQWCTQFWAPAHPAWPTAKNGQDGELDHAWDTRRKRRAKNTGIQIMNYSVVKSSLRKTPCPKSGFLIAAESHELEDKWFGHLIDNH